MYDPKAFLLTYEEIVQDWIYTGVVFLVRINADFIAFPFGFNHFFSCLWIMKPCQTFFSGTFRIRVGGNSTTWTTKIFFPACSPLFHQMKFIFLLFHLLGCIQERKKTIKNVNLFSVFCLVCSLLSLKLLYKCFFQLQKWAGGGGRGKSDVKSVLCGCKQPKDLIS